MVKKKEDIFDNEAYINFQKQMAQKSLDNAYGRMIAERRKKEQQKKQEDDKDLTAKILFSVIGSIIVLLGLFASIYFAQMNFHYEKAKCVNMNSETGSGYDFTNRVEINAAYNERCYYLNNHPMAEFNEVFMTGLLSAILFFVFVFMLYFFYKLTRTSIKEEVDYDTTTYY